MATRYTLILLVFLAAAAVPAVVSRGAPAPAPDVPQAALDALERGRYWRASRILDRFLDERADTTPAQMLMVAEAAAGWDDWATVETLLAGRPGLDDVAG
ncbi:MAG TPA: hypothetical protein VJ957_11405, partial [Longimicrobiales bacterium]|nr:hypothetical protein [Longimicrobiales bacterium]